MIEILAEIDRQSIEKLREFDSFVGDVDDILSEFLLFQFQLLESHRTQVQLAMAHEWPTSSFGPLFQQLRERGAVRRDVDSPDLLRAFKTVHLGLLHLWIEDTPESATMEKLVRLQMKLFSEGVKAGEAYEV